MPLNSLCKSASQRQDHNILSENKKSCTIGQHILSLQHMNNGKIRTVFLYKDYFTDFYNQQSLKVKDKIIWTFKLIETIQQVPKEYLKHLEGTDGLYEIRVQSGSDIYRIFCFFDEGKLIVLANGFQKKTQNTPRSEIEKALKIKREYEKEQ
jgi:phage-related protein